MTVCQRQMSIRVPNQTGSNGWKSKLANSRDPIFPSCIQRRRWRFLFSAQTIRTVAWESESDLGCRRPTAPLGRKTAWKTSEPSLNWIEIDELESLNGLMIRWCVVPGNGRFRVSKTAIGNQQLRLASSLAKELVLCHRVTSDMSQ